MKKHFIENKRFYVIILCLIICCAFLFFRWNNQSSTPILVNYDGSTLSDKERCYQYSAEYDKEVKKEGKKEDKSCRWNVFYSSYFNSCIAEKSCSMHNTDYHEYQMKNLFDDRLIFTCFQGWGEAHTTIFNNDINENVTFLENTWCSEVDGLIFNYIE